MIGKLLRLLYMPAQVILLRFCCVFFVYIFHVHIGDGSVCETNALHRVRLCVHFG